MTGTDDLLRCIERGDVRGVKEACSSKGDANIKIDGVPILHIVALRGLPDMVDALIGAGAEIDARDEAGFTPLMYVAFLASDPKHHQVLDRLLKAGADINAKHEPSGRTAIDMAAQFLNANSLRQLADAGAAPTTHLSRQWARDALARDSGRSDL